MPKSKQASNVYFVDEILDERIYEVYLRLILLDWFSMISVQ